MASKKQAQSSEAKTRKKPSTKKTVSKKPATKKATKSTAHKSVHKSKKPCACKKCCRPEEAFWVNNGPVVESLSALKHAFREMSNDQFKYHTQREGNDFARWIRDSLNNERAAAKIEKAKTKAGATRALSMGCCK